MQSEVSADIRDAVGVLRVLYGCARRDSVDVDIVCMLPLEVHGICFYATTIDSRRLGFFLGMITGGSSERRPPRGDCEV